MQLFKTEMFQFHPPQHAGAYRGRRLRPRYGCRPAPAHGFATRSPHDQAEGPRFPAPDTIVIGDEAGPAMDRAA